MQGMREYKDDNSGVANLDGKMDGGTHNKNS